MEPPGGWTPSALLKSWRNNVGPTTAVDPDSAWDPPVPGSAGRSMYNDESEATRRTAYWFNMERKWSMCKCVFDAPVASAWICPAASVALKMDAGAMDNNARLFLRSLKARCVAWRRREHAWRTLHNTSQTLREAPSLHF